MRNRAESRLDSRSRTIVPDEVLRLLAIGPGDTLVYEVQGESVVLRSARAAVSSDLAELDRIFADWSDPADDAAFAYLSERSSGG